MDILVVPALEKGGHTVTPAGSLTEGMELLRKSRFDLILTDWDLGVGDAMPLVSDAQGLEIPVIVMTGGGSGNFAAALPAGASAVIAKPFDLGVLTATVTATAAVHPEE